MSHDVHFLNAPNRGYGERNPHQVLPGNKIPKVGFELLWRNLLFDNLNGFGVADYQKYFDSGTDFRGNSFT